MRRWDDSPLALLESVSRYRRFEVAMMCLAEARRAPQASASAATVWTRVTRHIG